jgi:sulfur carrier protein
MPAITLNGQPKRLDPLPATLADLLVVLGYTPGTVAVALEGTFVPKSQHGQTPVVEGLAIEIVAPMQGG